MRDSARLPSRIAGRPADRAASSAGRWRRLDRWHQPDDPPTAQRSLHRGPAHQRDRRAEVPGPAGANAPDSDFGRSNRDPLADEYTAAHSYPESAVRAEYRP